MGAPRAVGPLKKLRLLRAVSGLADDIPQYPYKAGIKEKHFQSQIAVKQIYKRLSIRQSLALGNQRPAMSFCRFCLVYPATAVYICHSFDLYPFVYLTPFQSTALSTSKMSLIDIGYTFAQIHISPEYSTEPNLFT